MKQVIEALRGLALFDHLYPHSVIESGGAAYFLVRREEKKLLGVAQKGEADLPGDLQSLDNHPVAFEGVDYIVDFCELTAENAAALRELLPEMRACLVGLALSAGTGDRLGLATPGHVRAVRDTAFTPIFAQQSIREMARTGRSPRDVMDDAMWGAFQEGWHEGFGADADHLKTTADADSCIAAGFTWFTVDPGDHVDNAGHTDSIDTLREKAAKLPWDELETTEAASKRAFAGVTFELEGNRLAFSEEEWLRAVVKYGRSVVHAVKMYRHLVDELGAGNFDLEISVDETETPTSTLEHYFIASELKRLGVEWVALAPRYVGRFEKGVDYIGDLEVFEKSLADHAAIARQFGPYKLSIHSGSDKFSVYPIISRLTDNLVHLKTAGTSYLEAVRAIAEVKPDFFREILAFALSRYDDDRATYHVSAKKANVPALESVRDEDLPGLLDQFDTRQVLHVTYGSVLNDERFAYRFMQTLRDHEEAHYAALERHFRRHLAPFEQNT